MAANTDLDNTNKAHEQAAQVLERELRIEQDKFHRAERELEGWKGLRVEKENLRRRSGSFNNQAPLADSIGAGNRRTSGYSGSPSDKIIRRVSGAKERKASGTKGFL